MKAKLKLDMGAVKGFFIEHGEKIVVGLAVVILASFAVSIFQRETLPADLQAKVITEKSAAALHNVSEGSTAPPASESVIVEPIAPKALVRPVTVAKLWIADSVIRPNIFEAPQKRTDPKLFPVVELQATAGRGLLAVQNNQPNVIPIPPPNIIVPAKKEPPAKAPPARGRPGVAAPPAGANNVAIPGRGPAAFNPGPGAGIGAMPGQPGAPSTGEADPRYYVVVTGAIPEDQQRREFAAKFRNAQKMVEASNGPDAGRMAQQDSDVPEYVWWRLERTDLSDGTKTMIDCGDVEQVLQDRKTIGQEVVMASLKPTNVFNKLFKDMAKWAGAGADVVDPEYKGPAWMTWPLPPLVLHDWGPEATHPRIPLAEEPVAAGNNGEPDDKKPAGDGFDGAAVPPAGQRGFPGVAGPGRRPMMPVMGPDMGQGAVVKQIPYRLFRFVDFNVEPGHSYQYRVQMVLRNPNFGKDPEVLEKPELAKEPYRETDWSEKSKAATPPTDARVLAAGIVKTTHGAEPRVKADVLVWDKTDAIELLDTFELDIGGIANFAKTTVKDVLDPVKHQPFDKEKQTDFLTNTALIDVRGTGGAWDKPANGISEPPEMLLLSLDAKGKPTKMTVVNQAEDKSVVDEWEKYHKPPPADAAAPIGGVPFGQTPNNGGGIFGPQTPKDNKPTPKKTGR